MTPGQGLAVLAVAAADHPDHRDVPAQAVAHHAFIAGGDAFVRQLQVTQRVILMHIDACVIQHQVRLVERQQVVERVVYHLQVIGVAHALGQWNVPITFSLACGKILFAVQGNGYRVRGVVQNPCSPVALVYVAIEDQHPIHPTAFQQVMADHRQVIEDAVSMTFS